jgi:hypothetical protein
MPEVASRTSWLIQTERDAGNYTNAAGTTHCATISGTVITRIDNATRRWVDGATQKASFWPVKSGAENVRGSRSPGCWMRTATFLPDLALRQGDECNTAGDRFPPRRYRSTQNAECPAGLKDCDTITR